MKGYDAPNPPDDLMDMIKERLKESQKRKQHKKSRFVFVLAVLLIFILPVSAYPLVKRYWGSSLGVRMAIENNEAMPIDKNLQYDDMEIMIENAVWEEDELAVTYSSKGDYCTIGVAELVDANENRISNGGSRSSDGLGGVITFRGIDEEVLQGKDVWLKIYSLNNRKPFLEGEEYSFPFLEIKATPEMKKGEFVKLNKELEVEQGTFLFEYISFGETLTAINYQFIPQEKYKEIYNSQVKTELIPRIRLEAKGKNYYSRGGSISQKNLNGSISFEAIPIEKLKKFRISVLDNFALVDWKLPIAVQNKEAKVMKLAENIILPEGKLILTSISQGTKSTAIDFSFEPGSGFEGINSIYLDAFLRSEGKYYNKYGIDYKSSNPGLNGTIKFDPVKYDNIEKLEFIPGLIKFTYKTDARLTVSPNTIPQTIMALGRPFIIDKMELKKGKTLLHIDYGKENRKFYDARVRLNLPKNTDFNFTGSSKLDYLEYENNEQLAQGFEQLKNNLGGYGLDKLNYGGVNKGHIDKSIEISGEHEQVEVIIDELTSIRFCGEIMNIPAN